MQLIILVAELIQKSKVLIYIVLQNYAGCRGGLKQV